MITIEGLPETITHEQVLEAVRLLGFDPNRMRSIRLSSWTVDAEVFVHSNGRGVAVRRDRDEAATHTVTYVLSDEP